MSRLVSRAALVLLLLLVIAIAWHAWRLAERGGLFAAVTPIPLANCELIPGTVGGEDIEFDPASGWVFVSAHDRRAAAAGTFPRGAIHAARADRLGAGFLDLTAANLPGALPEFGPHGISLHSGPDGTRLAVVNHRSATDTTVELYAVDYADHGAGENTPVLRHLRTIASELFTQPNDIALVGPETFYVTNDHHFSGWLENVETYLMLDVGTLVYGDGDSIGVAASGFTYGNSVNVSPDGRVIYLTETTDGVLRVFDRDPATGALMQRAGAAGRIDIGRGPDNIEVTPDGALWIASHPQPLKLSGNAADPANASPSAFLRLRVDENGQPKAPEILYADDGAQFSGASSVVPVQDRLLGGSVYGDHLLSCPTPAI